MGHFRVGPTELNAAYDGALAAEKSQEYNIATMRAVMAQSRSQAWEEVLNICIILRNVMENGSPKLTIKKVMTKHWKDSPPLMK